MRAKGLPVRSPWHGVKRAIEHGKARKACWRELIVFQRLNAVDTLKGFSGLS